MSPQGCAGGVCRQGGRNGPAGGRQRHGRARALRIIRRGDGTARATVMVSVVPGRSPARCRARGGLALLVAAAALVAPARAADPAPPPPAADAWSLRPLPGRTPVASVGGPGVIHSLSLLCFEGVPVTAIALRGRPTVAEARLTLEFPTLGRIDQPIGRQPGGGENVWYADLRGSPLPRLLAGRDSEAAVTINGVRQGTISLRGSTAAIRAALASCYRF